MIFEILVLKSELYLGIAGINACRYKNTLKLMKYLKKYLLKLTRYP
jgi:hypothetical protein